MLFEYSSFDTDPTNQAQLHFQLIDLGTIVLHLVEPKRLHWDSFLLSTLQILNPNDHSDCEKL
jgi:hypothetical protein